MNQVPADRVIALLTQQLADLHRENAILTVQVQLLEESAATPAPVTPVVDAPTSIPFPPPVPAAETAAA